MQHTLAHRLKWSYSPQWYHHPFARNLPAVAQRDFEFPRHRLHWEDAGISELAALCLRHVDVLVRRAEVPLRLDKHSER